MVKTSGGGEAEELLSSTIPGESVMVKTSGGGEAEEIPLLLLREQEQDQQSLSPHPSVSQLEPVLHHHFLHKI
jgi:hypothetical protein